MANDFVERYLPTVHAFLENRREMKSNQLPEHLRPISTFPIYLQIIINLGVSYTLISLMWNRDDVFSEGKAAAVIAVCMFLIIFSIVQAVRLKRRFRDLGGQRLAGFNFWLMIFTFLCLPAAIAMFMN